MEHLDHWNDITIKDQQFSDKIKINVGAVKEIRVNPSNNKLTLGDEIEGFTAKQLNINKSINNTMNKNNKVTSNLKNDVKKLNKKTSDNIMELNNQKKFIIMGI